MPIYSDLSASCMHSKYMKIRVLYLHLPFVDSKFHCRNGSRNMSISGACSFDGGDRGPQ